MKQETVKNQEVDTHDMLTPQMAQAIDMLAYLFLKQSGFNTEDCDKKTKKGNEARERLQADIKAKGLQLNWHMPTSENKIFCYFTLSKGDKTVATSRTLEFVCQMATPKKEDDKPSE